ncbi:MAG: EscU/YscU/HrcU family type III secretion system export apparatus switch protein [Pseudomonadota bacterium]
MNPLTSEAGKDDGVRIAVALRYCDDDRAPVVVATGRGDTARKIAELAEEAGVSIEENPLLAQALSAVPLDETIPEELYLAVAEVIGWVLQQRRPDADQPITAATDSAPNVCFDG